MDLRLSHVVHLYNVFRENDGKENYAQLIEEEFYKMFDKKSLNREHDCNVASMNSLNIHDASDIQAIILGMLYLMKMIFLFPQVLMCKFVIMVARLLFMMITMMNVGLEECKL